MQTTPLTKTGADQRPQGAEQNHICKKWKIFWNHQGNI